jgi:transposase-like protein
VYIGVVVVLGAVLRHGPSARRVTKLAEELDVDRRTLQRWRRWWLERFPKTTTWASLRARLMPPVDECVLPRSLVERFAGEHIIARISALLGHLAMDGEAPW